MAAPNYALMADQIASRTAQQYGLDPGYFKAIFHAQINQESGFSPTAHSPAGALGIAQIVPKYHPGVDPMNPQAALSYAAKWDAQNFKKYGDAQDVLSVYNSGRPWSVGRGIGETNNYVKSILAASKMGGGSVRAGNPQPRTSLGNSGGFSNQRAALIQSLIGLATAPSQRPQEPLSGPPSPSTVFNPLAGSTGAGLGGIANILNAAWGTPGVNKPPGGPPPPGLIGATKPGAGSKKIVPVPPQFATRGGISVTAPTLSQAEQLSRQFGVKINSGYRSPKHNAEVGGAPNSDHLSGNAVDFVGSPKAMRALYNYAQSHGYAYVEPWSQTGGSHVHISFARGIRA